MPLTKLIKACHWLNQFFLVLCMNLVDLPLSSLNLLLLVAKSFLLSCNKFFHSMTLTFMFFDISDMFRTLHPCVGRQIFIKIIINLHVGVFCYTVAKRKETVSQTPTQQQGISRAHATLTQNSHVV